MFFTALLFGAIALDVFVAIQNLRLSRQLRVLKNRVALIQAAEVERQNERENGDLGIMAQYAKAKLLYIDALGRVVRDAKRKAES